LNLPVELRPAYAGSELRTTRHLRGLLCNIEKQKSAPMARFFS
jgi:hypothetical protein